MEASGIPHTLSINWGKMSPSLGTYQLSRTETDVKIVHASAYFPICRRTAAKCPCRRSSRQPLHSHLVLLKGAIHHLLPSRSEAAQGRTSSPAGVFLPHTVVRDLRPCLQLQSLGFLVAVMIHLGMTSHPSLSRARWEEGKGTPLPLTWGLAV